MYILYLLISVHSILLEDCDEPIPNWPHKYHENLLIHLYLMQQGSTFLNKLLVNCLILVLSTYIKVVLRRMELQWRVWIRLLQNGMKLYHFGFHTLNIGNASDSNSIWALYKEIFKRFKELQKWFNTWRDERIKESLITFLNSSLGLPKCRNCMKKWQKSI